MVMAEEDPGSEASTETDPEQDTEKVSEAFDESWRKEREEGYLNSHWDELKKKRIKSFRKVARERERVGQKKEES